MNTILNTLIPNLMVEDVNECINFYHRLFGFNEISRLPETDNPEWALMGKDGVQVMFTEEKSLKNHISELRHEKPGGGFVLYIRTVGLNELYQKISESVDVVEEPKDTSYAIREFTIRDLNGYYITFAENINS